MIKKILAAAVLICLIFSLGINCGAADLNSPPAVLVDGVLIGESARIVEGAVYLPLRAVCETLGYTVSWRGTGGSSVVTIKKDKREITLNLTAGEISEDGHTSYMAGNGCLTFESRTYMEAGLLSESFGLKTQRNSETGAVMLSKIDQNPVSVATMKVASDIDNLSITLQIPQISGLGNSEIEGSINSLLRGEALYAENQGLLNAYELKKAGEAGTGSPNRCETWFDYRVKYNRNGLLSLILTNYQYSGGAHGSTVQTAYTFDLKTGKTLELQDFMKSGSNFTSYMDSAVRAEIDKRVASGSLVEFGEGKFRTIGDYPDFYLSNDGVVVYFQQYEYFPYAAGIQEFLIRYEDLKELLLPGYGFLYK